MKPQVSPADIASFLAERYASVEGLQQLAEGEESQAYAVVANNRNLVVRINGRREGFDKDAYVASNWPLARAPRILNIEPIFNAWCCISDHVSGTTLQALGRDADAYGQEVVGMLDALATSDTSGLVGYGPFDASGRGLFRSWQEFMLAIDGPQDLVRFVCEYEYGDQRALVHGDFGSNNVLVENGRVTGVIDWSEAMVGDPLYDVANLFFWRSWLQCMDVQCRYMEIYSADRLSDQEKLLRYQVRIGLQVSAEARSGGDTRMERWALDRSRFILTAASAD